MARAALLRALALAAVLAAPAAGGAGPAWPAEEDAGRAFAAARASGALVLVDVWAPW